MTERKSQRDSLLDTDEPDRPASDGDPPAVHGMEAGSPSPEQHEERAAEAELDRQLDDLQAEFDSLNERHLRLAAEFKNYRRRAEGEMSETWSRAQADLVRRFLDVLDDLQRVSTLDPSDDSVKVEAIVEGVDLVVRNFVRALEESGVEMVDPAGEPFDPERMEAVLRVPAPSPEEDDRVAQVFQKGYLLKGHLIRPARVSVSKHE
jgi:molecular chaperone GrpE